MSIAKDIKRYQCASCKYDFSRCRCKCNGCPQASDPDGFTEFCKCFYINQDETCPYYTYYKEVKDDKA